MSKIRENWAGLVSVQRQRGLFFGSAGNTNIHAPHAIKICFAIESGDEFDLRVGTAGEWNSCQAVIIAPDQPHQINGHGKNLALFYLMPETAEARKVSDSYLNHNHGFEPLSRMKVAELSSLLNQGRCTSGEAFDLNNQLIYGLKLTASANLRQSEYRKSL